MAIEETVTLSERLGPDTIREWQHAASRQWDDAEILRENRRPLAAIYLYGYVAEILIKGAYFRLIKKSLDEEITTRDRRTAISESEKPMNLHDIAGWAKLLVRKRIELGQPNESPSGDEINHNATTLYLNWRETIRYHDTEVAPAELAQVHKLAIWFRDVYPNL